MENKPTRRCSAPQAAGSANLSTPIRMVEMQTTGGHEAEMDLSSVASGNGSCYSLEDILVGS